MRASSAGIALALLSLARPAVADDNDLVLSRFVKNPAGPDAMGNIPVGAANPNLDAQTKFRSLASELGVVLAPKLLSPADTIGFGGFQFSLQYSLTGISNNAEYWDAARRVDPSSDTTRRLNRPPGYMSTLGIFVSKGIWLPLPSFEIGAGAIQMQDSNIWSLQGYAKFALQEGFHDWPLPSLAVRGAAARLMGSADIDLTVASLDFSISKAFGIGGTMTFHPYAGFDLLWIVPRSEVLDATPWCDAFKPTSMGTDPTHYCPGTGNVTDLNENFVFPEQSTITRYRTFVGAKMKFYVLALVMEWERTFAGTSTAFKDTVTDKSGDQDTIAFSVALDF